MDIVGERPVVISVRSLNQHRLVAFSKQAAPPAVADVVTPGGRVLQSAHSGNQVGFRRFDQAVVVVSHQHPGVHSPTAHRTGFGDGGEEKPAVVIVMENRITPVATSHHVVQSTGKFNAQAPQHARRIRMGESLLWSGFAHGYHSHVSESFQGAKNRLLLTAPPYPLRFFNALDFRTYCLEF